MLKQPGGWLRSSNTFKECVIAHWSSDSAPKMIGTKHITEALDSPAMDYGRGAFYVGRRLTARTAGPHRRENAGTSSDKCSEKLHRRKSKVF